MTEGETRHLIERLREGVTVLDEQFHREAVAETMLAAADRLAVCLDVAEEMRERAVDVLPTSMNSWADRLAGLPAPATQEKADG